MFISHVYIYRYILQMVDMIWKATTEEDWQHCFVLLVSDKSRSVERCHVFTCGQPALLEFVYIIWVLCKCFWTIELTVMTNNYSMPVQILVEFFSQWGISMAVCFPGFSVGMITHPVTTGKSSLIRNPLGRNIGCYVSNSPWTEHSDFLGDGWATPFGTSPQRSSWK